MLLVLVGLCGSLLGHRHLGQRKRFLVKEFVLYLQLSHLVVMDSV